MDNAAGIVPIVIAVVAFEVFCIVDVVRGRPKLLPRWAWIVVCLVSIPLGGVLYLVIGRDAAADPVAADPTSADPTSAHPISTDPTPTGAPATAARVGAGNPSVGGPRSHGHRTDRSATPLAVRDLTKRYGDHAALDGVSLDVPAGSVFGLVGPNGAGKTTMLAILAGLRRPTSGSVSFGDVDSARVALLPDTPLFDPWLTAREVVDLSRCLAAPGAPAGSTADALGRVGLADAADRRVGGFSRGMLQRLGLAATIVGEPDVLLLDEPCSALDPLGRRDVLDLVGRLGGEHTVLFCSHILDDVQEVCDRVGVLRGGRLLFQGPLGELLVGDAAPAYAVRVRGRTAPVAELLRAQPWVASVEQLGVEELRLTATSLDEAERHLVPTLAGAGVPVVSLVPAGADLERVFLELVR